MNSPGPTPKPHPQEGPLPAWQRRRQEWGHWVFPNPALVGMIWLFAATRLSGKDQGKDEREWGPAAFLPQPTGTHLQSC